MFILLVRLVIHTMVYFEYGKRLVSMYKMLLNGKNFFLCKPCRYLLYNTRHIVYYRIFRQKIHVMHLLYDIIHLLHLRQHAYNIPHNQAKPQKILRFTTLKQMTADISITFGGNI